MPFSPLLLLWDLCVGNNIRLEGAGCEIKGHITMMISIDRQPWAHRGGPAFVTSKLNPIADPHRSLMNWPCSPSLFNWWRVHFQVHHHYVPRTHWFSKKHPHRSSYFFSLFSVGTLLHTIIAPWLALSSITRGIFFSLHFTAHVVFKKWICKSEGEFAHSGGVLQNYTHTKIHKTVFFCLFFFVSFFFC